MTGEENCRATSSGQLSQVLSSALWSTFNVDAVTQERVAGVISAAGTLAVYMLAESTADKAAVKKNNEEK